MAQRGIQGAVLSILRPDRTTPDWRLESILVSPSFTLPSSPNPFPLWPCSPWESWAAPPIVGMGTGKGRQSHQLLLSWGRSSSWPAGQEGEGLGLHRDLCDKGKVGCGG